MQSGDDFWAFSLHVYGQAGVADACIELQDRLAADVNLVLFALWLGAHGRRLEEEETRIATQAVIHWRREVVEALRRLRRRLKVGPTPAPSPQTEALREAIKASELAAEKIEQHVLEDLRNTRFADNAPEDPLTAATANVFSVLRISASVVPGEAETELICTILNAAIPTAPPAAIEAAVTNQSRLCSDSY
jgi:uncharacterized protein (TIGR02444 family)